VAQNGFFSGDTEELTAEVAPPARTRWYGSPILCQAARGAATNSSTVTADEITILSDKVRIRAQVKGQGGMGASGKFHAVYRIGWQPVAPALTGTATPQQLKARGGEGGGKSREPRFPRACVSMRCRAT